MDLWKQRIVHNLGHKTIKFASLIAFNLEAVSLGVKSAYLWDVSSVKKEEMESFLNELKRDGIISDQVHTAEIGGDIFAMNMGAVKSWLETGDAMFVDISDKAETTFVSPQVRHAINQIACFIASNLTRTDLSESLVANYGPNVMPTIYGMLLGYPAVYWCSTDINSLSMVPLTRFKISATLPNSSGILYSFSVPECLTLPVIEHVQAWLRHKLSQNITLNLDTEVVTLSTVVL